MVQAYTTAPVDYDGFGTRTVVGLCGYTCGKPLRLVETPEEHANWQHARYGSGMHPAYTQKEFVDGVRRGLITKTAKG